MTVSPFPHLAQRIFNRPVMILPEKAEIIVAALRDRLGIGEIVAAGPRQMAWFDDGGDTPSPEPDRYYQVIQGVAIIPVEDTLVQKLGTMRPWSGMTGYDGIRANFLQAMDDAEVRGVLFDIDSPGGEVAGCFDLVDLISSMRGIKPIRAMLSERAFSAGYAIASAADLITVPRTGGVGSIGTVVMHVDMSDALKKDGLKVTIIRSAPRKFEGNPYEPLSTAAQSAMQAEIDEVDLLFAATVAGNRSLTIDAVQATQAATYMGQAGVDAGFADAVAAPDVALHEFVQFVNS